MSRQCAGLPIRLLSVVGGKVPIALCQAPEFSFCGPPAVGVFERGVEASEQVVHRLDFPVVVQGGYYLVSVVAQKPHGEDHLVVWGREGGGVGSELGAEFVLEGSILLAALAEIGGVRNLDWADRQPGVGGSVRGGGAVLVKVQRLTHSLQVDGLLLEELLEALQLCVMQRLGRQSVFQLVARVFQLVARLGQVHGGGSIGVVEVL